MGTAENAAAGWRRFPRFPQLRFPNASANTDLLLENSRVAVPACLRQSFRTYTPVRRTLFFTYFLTAGWVAAQEPQFERVLVPVVAFDTEGAYGSMWETELVVLNDGDVPLIVDQAPTEVCQILCPSKEVPPHSVAHEAEVLRPSENQGAFLYLQKPWEALHLQLRAFERLDGWGNIIPVVGESAFRSVQRMLNVPTADRYRVRIRVYDFEGGEQIPVAVRVLSFEGDVLAEAAIWLSASHGRSDQHDPGFPPYPADGFVMLNEITTGALPDQVWVEVSAHQPIWAFVSVTDNVTQRATVITPDQTH